jgi:drug/metabolite transporter (DMT)-like permease
MQIGIRHPRIHFSFPQTAAAIAHAATMLLFVVANKTTTAANAILLQYLAPVLTVFIGAILLKERARGEHFAALSLVTAGMVFMFFDELDSGRLLGNILAALSSVTFSFSFVFMRMQKDGSPLESILLAHWLTAGICIMISLFLPVSHITLKSLAAIAVLGIVQVGLSAILFSLQLNAFPRFRRALSRSSGRYLIPYGCSSR